MLCSKPGDVWVLYMLCHRDHDESQSLSSAISRLPEMQKSKRQLDMHTNIATAVSKHIKVWYLVFCVCFFIGWWFLGEKFGRVFQYGGIFNACWTNKSRTRWRGIDFVSVYVPICDHVCGRPYINC